MNRATPQLRDFAKRLIAYEGTRNKSSRNKSSETKNPLPVLIDELRPYLATLMGSIGFRALLARALALATAEVPWLSTVQIEADGTWGGLEELDIQADRDELAKGSLILLAQLLGLLVAFIGETLTLQLVREVWPRAPLEDLDLSSRRAK